MPLPLPLRPGWSLIDCQILCLRVCFACLCTSMACSSCLLRRVSHPLDERSTCHLVNLLSSLPLLLLEGARVDDASVLTWNGLLTLLSSQSLQAPLVDSASVLTWNRLDSLASKT